MTTKLLVVLGATGVQGGSVVRTYAADPTYRIRAITRNPSSPNAQALLALSPNIEVAAANYTDVASLTAAFHGATVVFGVTDFVSAFSDPKTRENLLPGETIGQKCYDIEVAQGRNIITALLPIVNTTLEKFVFSTLSAANKISKGKYNYVYHFDSKAAITEEIRTLHKGLAAKTVYLQMGFYASNWSSNPLLCPRYDKTESVWGITVPGDPDHKHPIVCTAEDTGTLVLALEKQPAGTVLLGYSEMMSFKEWMEGWGRVLGVPVVCRAGTWEDWDKAIPGGVGRELAETKCYSGEFGFDGGEVGVKRPGEIGAVGLTKVEDYFKSVDWVKQKQFSEMKAQL